jgi:hypothetical protein
MTTSPQILVIGIGNDFAGDDAVGHVVVREFQIEGVNLRRDGVQFRVLAIEFSLRSSCGFCGGFSLRD